MANRYICLSNKVEVDFNPFLFTGYMHGSLLAEEKPTDGMYEWPPKMSVSRSLKPSVSHTMVTSHLVLHRCFGHPSTPILHLIFLYLNLSVSS